MPFRNQWVLDCENSDYSFNYGDSGTDACGFIVRYVTPVIEGYSVGKEEQGRREKQAAYFECRIVTLSGKND